MNPIRSLERAELLARLKHAPQSLSLSFSYTAPRFTAPFSKLSRAAPQNEHSTSLIDALTIFVQTL